MSTCPHQRSHAKRDKLTDSPIDDFCFRINSELKRERAWSRIHLIPLLMAEADRDAFRRSEAQTAREKEIMKDVPGWEAGKSVYNTKRYTPPNFVVL